ncbi:MAG: thiamine pyrophosphate-dependent enzyme, partial [Pseudomonadota bacterium]
MVLFIGQVARGMIDREAFQEIDFRRMFGQMAKWVSQIDDAERIPEYVSRAFHTAATGRPGPVVLALPEDMLTDRVDVADAAAYRVTQAHPGAAELAEMRDMMAAAQRPMAILGGGGWDPQAWQDFKEFAENFHLPVGTSFRAQSHFDNTHPNYVGDVGIGLNPKLAERVKTADLLLVVGARLGELTTSGYTLVEPPKPKQTLIHVYPDPEELGRVYQAALPINSGMGAFAAAAKSLEPLDSVAWAASLEQGRRDYLEYIKPDEMPGDVNLGEIFVWLRDRLTPGAIVTNGAGNYSGWMHRHFQFSRCRTQIGPTSGSMGYRTPAAVAAKATYPERMVVNFAGDGCYMMHGQELSTAVKYGLNVVNVIVN